MDIIPAEIIGTALLIILGDGVVAAVLLNRSKAENSGWIVITFGWGFAVMAGVYCSRPVLRSPPQPGRHPRLRGSTATSTSVRRLQYWVGEFIGAMIGAGRGPRDLLAALPADRGPGLKLAVFSTGPAIRNPFWNMVTEIIGTFVLVLGVLSFTDPGNDGPGDAAGWALLVAFLVVGIGLSLGGPTGYAINPARDLGPRIIHAILPVPGKGGSDWGYSWIPVVGPIVGGGDRRAALRRRLAGLIAMKKLINATDDVVRESLEGVEAAHGDRLRVSYDPAYVVRADAPVQGKVGVISGGGSGHEPMHGGFVGPGMLDAACPGEVFTSPTPDQMLEATKAVDGGAGVLHIVKNYTGDILNFEMAADLAKGEGIDVAAVVTNDDVAVQDSLYTAGRRGVGVTVLLEKIVGAAAEEGKSLAEVTEIANRVNAEGRSMGMALTSCVVPAAGEPTFQLGENEMEIGIGIHGEPGRERMPLEPADQITERLATVVVDDLPYREGDQVLAFVNGMGGTPLIELYIVYRALKRFLDGRGITISRNLIGPYITSLEMAGTSITLLRLDDELTRLWDAPVDTPGLRWK